MSTLSKLRRLVLRQDVSVREASRKLGISRNTASKWLKAGQMVEPRYPQRLSGPSILDPYKEQLSQWLKADSHRSKRERRGIKAMFEALRAQGFKLELAGSYGSPAFGVGGAAPERVAKKLRLCVRSALSSASNQKKRTPNKKGTRPQPSPLPQRRPTPHSPGLTPA